MKRTELIINLKLSLADVSEIKGIANAVTKRIEVILKALEELET